LFSSFPWHDTILSIHYPIRPDIKPHVGLYRTLLQLSVSVANGECLHCTTLPTIGPQYPVEEVWLKDRVGVAETAERRPLRFGFDNFANYCKIGTLVDSIIIIAFHVFIADYSGELDTELFHWAGVQFDSVVRSILFCLISFDTVAPKSRKLCATA
jgi:hypothetical protein